MSRITVPEFALWRRAGFALELLDVRRARARAADGMTRACARHGAARGDTDEEDGVVGAAVGGAHMWSRASDFRR